MEKVKKFLERADTLIIQHIKEPHIRKSRIKQLRNHRESIADYPIAVQYLDDLVEFAEVLNEKGAIEARPAADKALASLDELIKSVNTHGV